MTCNRCILPSATPQGTDAAPAVAGAGASVLFLAKDLDGRVLVNRAVLGQAGQGWVEVAGDGRTDSAPAAAAVGTHVFVAIKGLDGQVLINQADLGHPFGQWPSGRFRTHASPAIPGPGATLPFFARCLDR